MKRYLRDYLFLAAMAGLIILLDQVSKGYVRSHFAIGEWWSPWEWLTPYARIVYVSNTGVAFGMFQGMGRVLLVLAILVSAAIIYYYPRVASDDWTLRLALGLQLGGALGNVIDRIFIGHVTDFISLGIFPVFNVADMSITIGVIVLLLGVWMQDRQNKRSQADAVRLSPEEDPGAGGKSLHCE